MHFVVPSFVVVEIPVSREQEYFSIVLMHVLLPSLCISLLQPDDSQQFKLPREPCKFSSLSREKDLGPAACACKVSQSANMNESPGAPLSSPQSLSHTGIELLPSPEGRASIRAECCQQKKTD